jgi:two-component system chemotaxis sensor kinase CheA
MSEESFALDDELLQGFITESREHLETIEADLLAIEQAGEAADAELVNKVFRAAHSIKGCSGFLGLNKVKELAHKAETVLDMLRSHKIRPNAEVTNVLLAAFDKLGEMVNSPLTSEAVDTALEVEGLVELAASFLPQTEKATVTTPVEVATPQGSAMPVSQIDLERARRSGCCVYALEYDLIHDIERQGRNVLQLFHELEEAGEILDVALDFAAVGGLEAVIGKRLPLAIVLATLTVPSAIGGVTGLPPGQIRVLFDSSTGEAQNVSCEVEVPAIGTIASGAAVPAPACAVPGSIPPAPPITTTEPAPEIHPAASAGTMPANPAHPAGGAASLAEDTLRVNVGLLDTLMNLAGELVLSRNQFQAAIAQNNHRLLSSAGQRLSQVTSEIQDAIMRTRLQPIENVFSKLPRVVRDLCNSLGKEVKLDLRGKDVALDRSLVEGLSDPLTHMVRNAIDHGVESRAERVRAGKDPLGTLRVEARHEAGQVVIEIADDGKGIDGKRVAQAALAKGLITAELLKGMSPQEQIALILRPGLSTAEKVSDVSGRGVGMDVVKTNLDRLGGQLEINSTPGQGSQFRIKLPLTLTIIPALILSAEGERFAIPQINVEELLRIRPEETKSRIEVVGETEVLLLRDRILPLLRLDEFLGVIPTYACKDDQRELDRRANLADRRSPHYTAEGGPVIDSNAPRPGPSLPRRSDGRRGNLRGALEIAVITTGMFQYALVVQAFHNTEEIVVKPLGHHLKESREYAGATILGDGAVALILDAAGLAAKAELTSASASQRAREQEEADGIASEGDQSSHSLLLFHNAPDEHCAIPLGAVRRIERIKPEQVESAGGRRTMKYRDQSLPLVTLADTAQVETISGTRDLAVIVSNIYGREVGLLGAMPVDVAEDSAVIDSSTHRQKGIAGSAILRGHTTLIADLVELVDAVYPEWGVKAASHGPAPAAGPEQTTILLAEDSDFFRSQLRRFLEADGYAVLDAADGEIAWDLLQKDPERVQLVVTDIEMPNMDGLDLTRHIRADRRVSQLPVIALTSLASDEDMAKGRSAGVDDYQIKLDRDALMGRVHSLLAAAPQNRPMEMATTTAGD